MLGWSGRLRVRSEPAWDEALRVRRGPVGVASRAGGVVGVLLGLALVIGGHLLLWESGTHGWRPAPGGVWALSDRFARDPWRLVHAAGAAEGALAGSALEPRVSVVRNLSSAPFGTSRGRAWVLLLGGFGVLGLSLGLSVHPGYPGDLARRAWHLGAEHASWALLALVVLWIGGPLVARRGHEVLREAAVQRTLEVELEPALGRLRERLAAEGLAVDVEQRLVAIDAPTQRELASATLLRAAAPNPLDRWRTAPGGPVRVTPLVWVVAVPRVDGGLALELRAGLSDPRSTEHRETEELLRRLLDAAAG